MTNRWIPSAAVVAALIATVLSGAFPAAPARAELPPLIPREVLFGNPERLEPQVSPDGNRLAYLRPDTNDVLQVWLRTIGKTDDRQLTQDPKRGIFQYGWTWNNRELFYLQDNDGDENFHLYITDLETNETRDMTPIMGVQATPRALEPDHPDELIVEMNRRDRSLMEPWKCDLRTGALTLMADNPGNVRTWHADAQLAIRGATVGHPDGGGEFIVRDGPDGPWRTLTTWNLGDKFEPLAFSKDGRTVYAKSNIDGDTQGLYGIDTATGVRTLIASDPGADADHVVFDPKTHAIQAVSFDRLRPVWKVIDPSIQADWDALTNVAPGSMNLVGRDLADRTWIVAFDTDVAGMKYYAYDRPTKQATFLFSASPKFEQFVLAPVKSFEIRSRDGLSLPCYLTLPVGIPSKNLPMVLYVHGGPWARDFWGFEPNAQWLANRGYAVLQVNYRGSAGFGKSFLMAARKQFAGKMHDDLIDAVNWAVGEGIADPKRVGIMGASYGGYATLVGLSFTPDVFVCGVDIVGPSNLVTLVESFPDYWKPFLSARWYPIVGDPSNPEDRKDMLARSPIANVDRIRAPLLVGQGANDPRVKQAESDTIVAALRKRGVPVEYIVFPDEGHGFARPENQLKFSAAAEAFLAKHLGGRFEPVAAPKEAER
jgi:dipeptidyl aminopeptidase/acylaminoacyl peptidase